jgi:hypothetical protein
LDQRKKVVMSTEDTRVFLKKLFRPQDIFELRNKPKGGKQIVRSYWSTGSQIDRVVDEVIPKFLEKELNMWVGVLPRVNKNNKNPKLGRFLWCDLDATIKPDADIDELLANTRLPKPTMAVISGNGWHFYWELTAEYTPEVLRPYLKAIYEELPCDRTYDPTRVMRLPGTLNFKTEPPSQARLAWVTDDQISLGSLTFLVESIPKPENPKYLLTPQEQIDMPSYDIDTIIAAMGESNKHNILVGLAAYLRKNLHYNKKNTIALCRTIFEASGYSKNFDDAALVTISKTFNKDLDSLSGLYWLKDMGIHLKGPEGIKLTLTKKPQLFKAAKAAPRESIIAPVAYDKEFEEQEFWLGPGLVGPNLFTLWVAPPKVGKSFSVMQIGYALSKGEGLWGLHSDGVPKKVLYFQGELNNSMVSGRVKGLFADNPPNPESFVVTGRPSRPIDLVTEKEILLDLASGMDVVIIDPISIFHTKDENDLQGIAEVLDVIDYIKSLGKAVIVVHHTRKLGSLRDGSPVQPDFDSVRGTSKWFAHADALALQYFYDLDRIHTRVKFAFRAARDRGMLELFRLRNGGFTDVYDEFLADAKRGISLRLDNNDD